VGRDAHIQYIYILYIYIPLFLNLKSFTDVTKLYQKSIHLRSGAEPDIFIWGGLLEGPVLQQGELSVVCVGLSERDLKNFGGSGKIFGGKCLPLVLP